jgi:hypothetical protein
VISQKSLPSVAPFILFTAPFAFADFSGQVVGVIGGDFHSRDAQWQG